MTFSSLAFLFIFFPIVFLLYFICANNHVRNILLIIASIAFYAYGEPVAVFIMLISIVLNYFCGLVCGEVIRFKDDEAKDEAATVVTAARNLVIKRAALFFAIVLNIGLLFVFKYADFFLGSVGLSRYKLNIALPIGISFFTFQGLSYVVDVYRDKECVQKNLLSVMLYISFFPQLIAGPIVKYHDIREQLTSREFSTDRIFRGIQRFIFGLFKKVVIAGPLGLMADSIYGLDLSEVGVLSAWIAAISYMLQIYFDFSGYSDMAIGLGCIFGFDFKENFDKPYAASSIQIFWRKWHISLSTWFKEYVYIPLGGNRKGKGRTYLNKFIVFLLTGLWHGANWTFVCWGIMHAMGSIVEDVIKSLFRRIKITIPKWGEMLVRAFGHVYTLLFVMAAFVLFRADNLVLAAKMLGRMLGGGTRDVVALSLCTPNYVIALVLAVILSTPLTDKVLTKIKTWIVAIASIAMYVICIIMLISGGYNPFIYFRF